MTVECSRPSASSAEPRDLETAQMRDLIIEPGRRPAGVLVHNPSFDGRDKSNIASVYVVAFSCASYPCGWLCLAVPAYFGS